MQEKIRDLTPPLFYIVLHICTYCIYTDYSDKDIIHSFNINANMYSHKYLNRKGGAKAHANVR